MMMNLLVELSWHWVKGETDGEDSRVKTEWTVAGEEICHQYVSIVDSLFWLIAWSIIVCSFLYIIEAQLQWIIFIYFVNRLC